MMTKFAKVMLTLSLCLSSTAFAASKTQDLLVKLAPGASVSSVANLLPQRESRVEVLNEQWVRVQVPNKKASVAFANLLADDSMVESVQPNYPVHLIEDYKIADPLRRAALMKAWSRRHSNEFSVFAANPYPDNPAIPPVPAPGASGDDPNFQFQWGMIDNHVKDAWKVTLGNPDMVVAVIDTGVDYTHEDLLPNMWRNPGETGVDSQGRDKASNGVDDDGNGFVDDVVGWDFVTNDNKPYDLSTDPFQLLTGAGNPGHGTHCAGNVAARGNNAIGVAGVAPNVKIMALRFISEKGQGTTADAIKAIKYAVDNGAKIMSNSWGSEGEDPADNVENKALRDAVQYAQDKGVLFIAAAGNGHNGRGYNNDTDARPGYPASYDHDIIISVAALNNQDQLGSFSNWGARTVDIGAPGVAVYSTTVGSHYSDKVLDVAGFTVMWDGTSMATPHVAGAAALYWSAHPEKSWQDVKAAILGSAKKINSLQGKATSNGKLDVNALLHY